MTTSRKLVLLASTCLLLYPQRAHAFDPAYCYLFAREYTRIVLDHNTKTRVREPDGSIYHADKPKLAWLNNRNYSICLNFDQAPLLPKVNEASDDAWMDYLLETQATRAIEATQKEGTKPAIDRLPDIPATKDDIAQADAQVTWCKANYRTYDEKDGTVIRIHVKGRVPCPYPPD